MRQTLMLGLSPMRRRIEATITQTYPFHLSIKVSQDPYICCAKTEKTSADSKNLYVTALNATTLRSALFRLLEPYVPYHYRAQGTENYLQNRLGGLLSAIETQEQSSDVIDLSNVSGFQDHTPLSSGLEVRLVAGPEIPASLTMIAKAWAQVSFQSTQPLSYHTYAFQSLYEQCVRLAETFEPTAILSCAWA